MQLRKMLKFHKYINNFLYFLCINNIKKELNKYFLY